MLTNWVGRAWRLTAVGLISIAGLAMSGCDPFGLKPVARSVEELAGSIDEVAQQAELGRVTVENFPVKMEELLAQATADQKEILRTTLNKSQDMLSKTVQQGSVVPIFTINYVREQIAFDLRTLAAQMTGKPLPKPVPRIALPNKTTLIRRDIGTESDLAIVFTGSNLNVDGVRIVARGKDGAVIPLALSIQTPLMLVVPFDEANKSRLGEWTAIEVVTPNAQEKVSIAVMDPTDPVMVAVKRQNTQQVCPSSVTIWPEYRAPMVEVNLPPMFQGKQLVQKTQKIKRPEYDNEFKGNGPTTIVSAEFRVNPKDVREIQGKFSVEMYESDSKNGRDGDKTRGAYTLDWITVQVLDIGQSIKSSMPAKQSWTFRDANGTDISTETVTHPFIASFTVMGDTRTNQDMATGQGDASKSHVKVNFKPFKVDYEYEVKMASSKP